MTAARREYRQAIRLERLQNNLVRDQRLHSILTDSPASLYSYLRSSKAKNMTCIEKLSVGDKIYLGDKVPDGFYDSMTSLKSCDYEELLQNPVIAEQFSNYEHVLKLCKNKMPVPPISRHTAENLLSRIKKNVADYNSITASHYINAGEEGIRHYEALLNFIIADVNNASAEELNVAHGLILHKGHKKEKTSDRSYRTISSCPFLAKSLDLYLRDLYQEQWDDCQASTQYQGSGSSHEMAALLVTEVIQYSLNVLKKPIYLIALDAQSAFDRCLRQILVCELYKAGMKGEAVELVDNRLSNRSTVYEWNKQLLGPAVDETGFEQGGINSGDYYKLYNNEQLDTAQSSCLGVDLGSCVISAIGQADDVFLASNNLDSLALLITLTENYCKKYRVALVPAKTKLLGYANQKQQHLLEIAKLSNPVKINGQPVKFSSEAEHVGVTRNVSGNIPHIMNRIAAYKTAMGSVLSAGLARGHQGNPAAGLRVHQLYATPRYFSGLATLVLSKPETTLIDYQYKKMLEKIQRLHDKTPRSVVHLMAGTVPGEAVLHLKQLSLFMMVCHLPGNPINTHARNILLTAPKSAKSWFQQVRCLCLMYGLHHPLQLLDHPPSKAAFKVLVKKRVAQYWEDLLRDEAAGLPSLHYFVASCGSLTSPHPIWTSSGSNSFENRKSQVLARMVSGRFRSEYLCRHWSDNRLGHCQAETCVGVVGDLEHLLVHCPALAPDRTRLWNMFFSKSVHFPPLFHFLQEVEKSKVTVKL